MSSILYQIMVARGHPYRWRTNPLIVTPLGRYREFRWLYDFDKDDMVLRVGRCAIIREDDGNLSFKNDPPSIRYGFNRDGILYGDTALMTMPIDTEDFLRG